MIIAHLDNKVLIDLNSTQKFDILAQELVRTVKINEDHKVMNGMPVRDYVDILRRQIEIRNEKFKLLVALDFSTKRLVAYSAFFIVRDDNQKDIVLIYGAYFQAGFLPKILPHMLAFTDAWSLQWNCTKTKFGTTRHAKAYERLMKQSKIGFKISPLVLFERENSSP